MTDNFFISVRNHTIFGQINRYTSLDLNFNGDSLASVVDSVKAVGVNFDVNWDYYDLRLYHWPWLS